MATSSKPKRRNAAQLAADGFAALAERLGMAEAVRYVQLYHQGSGDYTRERQVWLDTMSHEQIASLMRKMGKDHPRKRTRRTSQKASR